jgi:hypothetical protein
VRVEKKKKATVKIEQIKILTRIPVFIINRAIPTAVELTDPFNDNVSFTGNLNPIKISLYPSTVD